MYNQKEGGIATGYQLRDCLTVVHGHIIHSHGFFLHMHRVFFFFLSFFFSNFYFTMEGKQRCFY